MKKTIIITMMMLAIMMLPVNVEANSPIIKMDIANYDPMPVQPGQFVDVWINVQNIGTSDARDIEIEFKESPYFELVNPENKLRQINVLGTQKDYSLRYRFKVSDDVVEGTNTLRFEYTLGNMPGVVSTTNLRLDVKSTETPISISSVRTRPDPVEPGEKTELTIAVANPSTSSNLRDVNVALQLADLQGGAMQELPFSPIDSTNRKSINRIQPQQTTEFRFNLITNPDAEAKIYKVPTTFSYFDDTGNRYEETSIITIKVNSEPDLYGIIESTTLNKNKKSGEINFDIINQGTADIKLLTAKLKNGENYEVTSSSQKEYLGNIETDDFKSARYNVKINENVEQVTYELKLTYRDALNNQFEETLLIEQKLRDAESNGNGTGTIIVILVIIGIIAYIWNKKRQRRKKMLEEDDD